MFFLSTDEELEKVILLYIISTCAYVPLLLGLTAWTIGIYSIGHYSFNPLICTIMILEIAKYFAGQLCIADYTIANKKPYPRKVRSVFNWLRLKEGTKLLSVVGMATCFYFLIAILFGAEVLNRHEQTLMFSFLLAVLTIFPLGLNLRLQTVGLLLLTGKPNNKLDRLMLQNVQLTLFGAWLGAFVIPLDWDRPWQVWPIPCMLGALTGYFVSHLAMVLRVSKAQGKKLK